MDGSSTSPVVPEAYANALLLRARGLPPKAVAQKLDIPAGAIDSFLRVAEAKLDHLMGIQPETAVTQGTGEAK
jgi:DNA-directed RNA polymerase specialized sigma24 family protein